ncbi:hypothetical protein QC764_0039000 [Podospora pseudoanserina]|uniref:Uncharacterized protein n=1 Tax=Podospora pseudoanserina TaxID=2609844 RepID=A0ABR0IJ54_9PEZI|nr:hypothetical protein QC764_0039000 [Podospora pseudoanserina]
MQNGGPRSTRSATDSNTYMTCSPA